MNDRELVRRVCAELGDVYGAAGEAAGRHLEEWLSDSLPLAYPESILEHLRQGKRGLVFDAFWQLLPFGTGGRRGPVGYGPNRLNPATVAMTVQGHCDYLTSAQASARRRCRLKTMKMMPCAKARKASVPSTTVSAGIRKHSSRKNTAK